MTTLQERAIAAFNEYEATKDSVQAKRQEEYRNTQATTIALWFAEEFGVVIPQGGLTYLAAGCFATEIEGHTYKFYISGPGDDSRYVWFHVDDNKTDITSLTGLGKVMTQMSWEKLNYK